MLLFSVILILAVPRLQKQPKSHSSRINLGNKVTIQVDVADTQEERNQGYSNHPPIDYQEGMLFVFDQVGVYPFWMKEMLFDLDFITIRKNKVLEIFENIKAPVNNQGILEYVNPTKPFDRLLEVKSGFTGKFGIKVGDLVEIVN